MEQGVGITHHALTHGIPRIGSQIRQPLANTEMKMVCTYLKNVPGLTDPGSDQPKTKESILLYPCVLLWELTQSFVSHLHPSPAHHLSTSWQRWKVPETKGEEWGGGEEIITEARETGDGTPTTS